ncbi:MAG: lipopolysaccharide biosynthesis protein [Nitrososphaerota archaeon]
MSNQIKEITLKSVKWVTLAQILPKLISPIISVVLLTVFKPEDYGVIGICNAFISFFNMLQGFGFADFIIRMKDEDENTIYTAYWFNIFLSFVLFVILLILTPLIAYIYSEEKLIFYLPTLSLNLIINSIGLIPWAILRKQMQFRKLFYINFAPLIVSVIVTLPLGYLNFGPWAIIIGQITLTILTNIFYIKIKSWSFIFLFDKRKIKEIINFSKFVFFERLQEYIYENIDVFIIGYFLGLDILGKYVLAKSISLIIFNLINSNVNGILYPAFQKFSDDLVKIRKNFLEVEKRVFFINIPIIIFMTLNASNLITIIFPQKWVEVAPIISIILIGDGIAKSFSIQRDIFKLLGKPEIYPKSFLINLSFAILVYTIITQFGFILFLLAKVINDILFSVIQYVLSKRELKYKNNEFFNNLKPILLSALGMILFNILFIKFLPYNLFYIVLTLILSASIYLTFFYLLDRISFLNILKESKIILGFN